VVFDDFCKKIILKMMFSDDFFFLGIIALTQTAQIMMPGFHKNII